MIFIFKMKEKLVYGFLFLTSLLPFWCLYILSDILFILIYYIFRYRKKVVYENLRNAFPEKSATEIHQIAFKFYRYFPDLIVESIKMASISSKEVLKRFELLNQQEVLQHLEDGKSVILVCAHYGNWELAVHRVSLMIEKPKLIIYKPLNNKIFNTVHNNIRTRFGATMVPMKQILRHIVQLKKQPHVSVFAADQTPTYQDSDYFLNFLNQDTLVYTGAERIARITKNPIVFCQFRRKKKRGYYSCNFVTLVRNPDDFAEHEITKIHNQYTEELITEEPAYWLWSHRRWKRKRRN